MRVAICSCTCTARPWEVGRIICYMGGTAQMQPNLTGTPSDYKTSALSALATRQHEALSLPNSKKRHLVLYHVRIIPMLLLLYPVSTLGDLGLPTGTICVFSPPPPILEERKLYPNMEINQN